MASIVLAERRNRDAVASLRWGVYCGFEPRDLWLGIYWEWEPDWGLNVWICLLPTLPLKLCWRVKHRSGGG